MAIAAAVVGVAIHINNGNYHPAALACITAALACAALAVAGVPFPFVERWGPRGLGAVIAAALVVQVGLLYASPPEPLPGVVMTYSFRIPLTIAGMLSLLLLPALFSGRAVWRRVQQTAFPAFLLVHLVMGAWVRDAIPFSMVDVFLFQTDSSVALLRGQNPYGITFDDLSGGTSTFYAPGVQRDGRLHFGFPYPPLSLLLAIPGFVFGGDVRYSHLVSITLAGALLGYARRGPWAPPAAALFLLTPRGFFVLTHSWTEPFVVLLLAAVVFCACRLPRMMPWVLGLFWAVKQYVALSAPLALLLLPRPVDGKRAWALVWRAVVAGAAVTLPLALWDLRAFRWSAIELQMYQPFRPDALSYPAALAGWRGMVLPSAVAFVGLAVAEALALARGRRTPAGFAGATAFAFLVFFSLSKQAFANYYYLVIGAAACAVAASAPPAVNAIPEPAASTLGAVVANRKRGKGPSRPRAER